MIHSLGSLMKKNVYSWPPSGRPNTLSHSAPLQDRGSSGKKTNREISMYICPRLRLSSNEWIRSRAHRQWRRAITRCVAGEWRSRMQHGCGQSSWSAGDAERSTASRVAALRHLTPHAHVWSLRSAGVCVTRCGSVACLPGPDRNGTTRASRLLTRCFVSAPAHR